MQRHDPIDELVRRAHERTPGAPAGFAGKLHARVSAEGYSRRRARLIYIQAAVAVAAVLILALAIGLNPQWFAPAQIEPEPQPQAKSNRPTPDPKAPEQKPEPQPPVNAPAPAPKPEPTPEPEQPARQPEQPTPEPERPAPQPEVPDDVVEKPEPPEPKDPEDTTPTPEKPADRTVVAALVSSDAKLKLRYGEEAWRDLASGEALYAGVRLSAGREAVDLTLAGGALARFDGEITLAEGAFGLAIELVKDSIYIDNLGLGIGVTIVDEVHNVVMTDGVCFVILDRTGLEAACLHGSLALDGENVEAGTYRKATARGVGEAKEFRGDGMLKNLPARVLLREDFDKAPPGGMYEEGERLDGGLAVCDRQPGYIAFRYNPTFSVLPGTVLRVRLRATDVKRLELELFTQPDLKLLKRNKEIMFKHIFSPVGDDWRTVEFALADIAEKENPDRKIESGDLLRNFKLHFTGKKLEIDWVEFVRVQE